MYSRRRRVYVVILAGFITACVGIGLYLWALHEDTAQNDMTAVNSLYMETLSCMEEYESVGAAGFEGLSDFKTNYDFVIVDFSHHILYRHGNLQDDSVEAAVKQNHVYFYLPEREAKAVLIIDTHVRESFREARKDIAMAGFLLFLLMLLLSGGLYCYLEHSILLPFEKLKKFAASVAAGNLDLPLQMDKRRIFGAFTESFDILREELKLSRKKEYEANQSKKELVASLSHDIKTPVTSIKLMCEVLLAKNQEAGVQNKVKAIYRKVDQIDLLVTDMFQSTLEELGELQVNCIELDSTRLTQIIADADFEDRVQFLMEPLPCIIRTDPLRLAQVIGNVINNSYKYAGSIIEVSFEMADNCIYMKIRDYGSGVSEDELPHIYQKFYRGRNHTGEQKDGAGLGLYICHELMERMGGSIGAENLQDGFMVILGLRLA